MTSLWELENDLTYGTFNSTATQVADALKVEEAFKILLTEVKRLSTIELSLPTIQTELTTMTHKYEEILEVVRKIGKDYPEVVLAKPHLFAEKETSEKINNY